MKSLIPIVASLALVVPAAAQFTAADKDGRLEVYDKGKLVFAYQHQPHKEPKGGEIFAASAFIHPLTTPSGFVVTDIQPSDHLHHFGVWWPWKLVQVDDKKYVTWEMQKKEGRHDALSAAIEEVKADQVRFSGKGQTKILPKGGDYLPVIDEGLTMSFARLGEDAYVLDMELTQTAIKDAVTIPKYRYSGFAWRGPESWTSETSTMLSSGGHNRQTANHQAAKWCMVTGATPDGKATMLILSAAPVTAGQAELLRVWGPKQHHGIPFVNFNPVVRADQDLAPENKAVSHRRYRLIVADREISAEQAAAYWQEWSGK